MNDFCEKTEGTLKRLGTLYESVQIYVMFFIFITTYQAGNQTLDQVKIQYAFIYVGFLHGSGISR